MKPLEMHKAGGQPTGELKEAGSQLESPNWLSVSFQWLLFHMTVNPFRSISDLGTVTQHLYTYFLGKRENKGAKSKENDLPNKGPNFIFSYLLNCYSSSGLFCF